jgi:hypothetical protein
MKKSYKEENQRCFSVFETRKRKVKSFFKYLVNNSFYIF